MTFLLIRFNINIVDLEYDKVIIIVICKISSRSSILKLIWNMYYNFSKVWLSCAPFLRKELKKPWLDNLQPHRFGCRIFMGPSHDIYWKLTWNPRSVVMCYWRKLQVRWLDQSNELPRSFWKLLWNYALVNGVRNNSPQFELN